MDAHQIQSLKNLRNLCFQLCLCRKDNLPWPYTDISGSNPGPSEYEAELMMAAYITSWGKNELQNNPNLKNPISPEYALEVANKITGFLAYLNYHPENVDEAEIQPNTVAPAIFEAYEKYLSDQNLRKQARAAGQKPNKVPIFEHYLQDSLEIRHEELRQNIFIKEVRGKKKEIVEQKIKPVVEQILSDHSILPSLTPDKRGQAAEEIALVMISCPEVQAVQDFLSNELRDGKTINALYQDYQNNQLSTDKKELFEKYLNLNSTTSLPNEASLITRAFSQTSSHLKAKYHIPDGDLTAFIARVGEKLPQIQPSLQPAVSLQSLEILSQNPDTNRLNYQKNYQDGFFQVASLSDKLLADPQYELSDKRFLASNLYIHLRNQLLESDFQNPALLTSQEFQEKLKTSVLDFFDKNPFYRQNDHYQGISNRVKEVLLNNPQVVFGLKNATHATFSLIESPNRLPEKQRVTLHDDAQKAVQERVNEPYVQFGLRYPGIKIKYEPTTFFGKLTTFHKARLMAVGGWKPSNSVKAIDPILKFFANPEIINLPLDQGGLSNEQRSQVFSSGALSLDPKQRKSAAELLLFLKNHPTFHKMLWLPAKIQTVPVIGSLLSVALQDPSYLPSYLPKIIWYFQKYYIQLEFVEGLANQTLALKIPFGKTFRFNISFLQFKEKSLADKFWKNILWTEDQYGYHHCLITNPRQWAKIKIKRGLKNLYFKKISPWLKRKWSGFLKTAVGKLLNKLLQKAAVKAAGKVLLQVAGILLGISTGPIGWVGAVLLAYSLLRDLIPFLKKIEQAILVGLGMLLFGVIKLISSLIGAAFSFATSAALSIGSYLSIMLTTSTPAIGMPLIIISLSAVNFISGVTILRNMMIKTAFLDYEEMYGPISTFYGSCFIKDIHKTDVITDENKKNFVAKYQGMFPKSRLSEKIDQVIAESQAANLNPALTIAIWGNESHFSNYGESGLSEGNDFNCGIKCTENRPKTFDESLNCVTGKHPNCSQVCLSKTTFAQFMECYGPVADNNTNFIPNIIAFYRELVPSGPDAIECPGGTTGQFASQLINHLLTCYDNGGIINKRSFNDGGSCLSSRGVPQQAIAFINSSVNKFINLQCVGFAQAVEAGTGAGSGFIGASFPSAIDYFRELPGYQIVPQSQKNVMVGDLFFQKGTLGHVAIVVDVRGQNGQANVCDGSSCQFKVAQAIGDTGLVSESGWIHISSETIAGFLRRK